MKGLLTRLPKKLVALTSALVIVASLSATAYAAFGPNRPTQAWSPTVSGFDHVTFNSFTGVGNGVGDERDFLRGVQVGRDSVWSDPVANVAQGAEVEGKIYIHNNADASLNTVPDGNGGFKGVAKNVTVRLSVPTGSRQTQEATSYISADNAQPGQIFDTLTMTGANGGFFELQYEAGSGQLHADGATTSLTTAQEQALTGGGLNLGDQNGCFQYVREVTFRMKVKMPEYKISKQVTTPGSTDWRETLNSKPGDTVSWLITFKNVGQTELKSVKIVDEVPAGLTVVPGTVKLVNGNYPNGYIYPDSAIQANGRQINVDIGNYNPGDVGVAYVTYRTKIADAAALKCGLTTITNKAFATPKSYGAIWDTAQTVVSNSKTCANVTTKTLPNTGPGDVLEVFVVSSAGFGAAHRFYTSRRNKRY